MRLTLEGMIGTLRDQAQDLLTFHSPVLRNERNQLVTPNKEEWTRADLVTLPPGSERFITRLDEDQVQIVHEGSQLFVVGATFYNRCARIVQLQKFSDAFQMWEVLSGPFSFRVGTREEFTRLNNRILDDLRPALYEALFAVTPGGVAGEAEKLFWVLERLSDIPDYEAALLKGLYYRERREFDKYQLLARWVTSRVDASVNDFERDVEARVEWLKRERLSERPKPSAWLEHKRDRELHLRNVEKYLLIAMNERGHGYNISEERLGHFESLAAQLSYYVRSTLVVSDDLDWARLLPLGRASGNLEQEGDVSE